VLGRRTGTLYQMLDDLLDYCPDTDTGKPALGDFRQRRWTWPLLELPGASSRTFSFAARLFPAEFRQRVTRLYAFCRATDDLADGADSGSAEERLQLLAAWERLARSAHAGKPTGLPLLDAVMADAAAAGVPFAYVEELVEGMRMDVRGATFDTLAELDVYCYRVAGVIGQWLTRMCGISDVHVLERAACLGRAMQVTNILRDVGEDLQSGRMYIPSDILADCGLRPADLRAAAATGRLPRGYAPLLETMMRQADADYVRALEATPELPAWFRRAVVVAAHTYRGIHDGIRANGYDNLRRRAFTTGATKLRIAVRAIAGYDRRSPAAGLSGISAGIPLHERPATPAREPAAHAVQPGHATRIARPVRGGRGRVLRGVAGAGMIAGLAIVPLHTAPGAAQAEPDRGRAVEQPALPEVPAVGAHVTDHVAAYEARFASAPHDRRATLDLVRVLFLAGVDEADAMRRGTEVLSRLDDRVATAQPRPLLLAYEGGFAMLEAKHGIWPWARLRSVRAGLARLDVAVTAAPDNLEVRYLRLVNTLYLPGVFGRGDSAREDLHAVRRLLPHAGADLPPLLVRVMAEVAAGAP
jgi:15-cis-phytoene synthase